MKNITHQILFFGMLLLAACQQEQAKNSTAPQLDRVSHDIDIVEPPNWWVGFKNQNLQLLVHHPEIGKASVSVDYPGVKITKQHTADSPNYLFIDLELSDKLRPGTFNLNFKFPDGQELKQSYELKPREKSSEDYLGFNSSDVVYLITPDRFANGNSNNDVVAQLNEKHVDRADDYARHGGDIEGVIQHMDYISDMGFTAIWMSPVLTNDMHRASYHGYAITNLYEVDPRFGTTDSYKALAETARQQGIKLIMDQVANHCGLEHWWMQDLPFSDWVNHQAHFEKNRNQWDWKTTKVSNHRRTANQDHYASDYDKKGLSDGWFVDVMPDLNQRNPFMANYLIQNSIWWIETLGLGGIRQDTYPYPDKTFMSQWAGAIMTEYPNFNIVGEEWSYNPLLIGYWQDGNNNKDGYRSHLRSTMDFAMQEKVVQGLKEPESWDKGLVKIYEGLANDFAYPNPMDIMVFPDNHDMSRIYTQLGGDLENTKMALAYYLMMPRIPQIYYGTEVLLDDFEKPGDHGLIRTDFPGGWSGDLVNAFTGEGLSKDQIAMQDFLKTLLNYRKTSKAMQQGKTLHFAPKDGIYVLFRQFEDEIVGIILNKTEKSTLNTQAFEEVGLLNKTLKNIITQDTIHWEQDITINPKGVTLLSTKFN